MAQFREAIVWTVSYLDDMIPTSHARGPILATDTECIIFGAASCSNADEWFRYFLILLCVGGDTGGGLHVHEDDVALVVGDLDASEGIQDIAITLLQCVQQSHPCTFFWIIGANDE